MLECAETEAETAVKHYQQAIAHTFDQGWAKVLTEITRVQHAIINQQMWIKTAQIRTAELAALQLHIKKAEDQPPDQETS